MHYDSMDFPPQEKPISSRKVSPARSPNKHIISGQSCTTAQADSTSKSTLAPKKSESKQSAQTKKTDSVMPEKSPLKGSVYTIEQMISMKPPGDEDLPRLKSNGFIMLMNLISATDAKPLIKSPSKPFVRTHRVHAPASLVEHDGKRFLASAFAKNIGEFDEGSLEARQASANVHLNRLNERNLSNILADISDLKLSNEVLCSLLLDRISSCSDEPEKDQQLPTLAKLAKRLADNPNFCSMIAERSIALFDSKIQSMQSSLIITLGLAVWISLLFVNSIVRKNDYFDALERAINAQNYDKAIQIVRCALIISGPFIAKCRFTEAATFYHFLKENKAPNGYTSFLIGELYSMQRRSWVQPQAKKVERSSPVRDVDISQFIQIQFSNWVENPDTPIFFPPKAKFEQSLCECFSLFAKHSKDAQDFAYYVASIVINSSVDHAELMTLFKDYQQTYVQDVILDDNPFLWDCVFIFYANLIDDGIISLKEIFELIESIPKKDPQPNEADLIRRVCETVYISEGRIGSLLDCYRPSDEALAMMISMTESEADSYQQKIDKAIDLPLFELTLIKDAISSFLNGDLSALQPFKAEISKFFAKNSKVAGLIAANLAKMYGNRKAKDIFEFFKS